MNRQISLTVGLPIGAITGPESAAVTAAVKSFLIGQHDWTANDSAHSIDITDVGVASQPVGALYDYLLNPAGQFLPDRKAIAKREIGILGIGMNTIDLLVTSNGAPVESFTGSDTLGVRRLLEQANGDRPYTLAQLDDQLRAGTLDLTTALPIWQREVLGIIEGTWGKYFKRFASIICVGGGSILLHDALLRRFNGKTFTPDDPVQATARGLYKYSLLKGKPDALAFDAGFGSIKLWGKRGGLLMQSAVSTNGTRALGKIAGLKSVKRALHISNARGSFYVGQNAHNFGRPVQNLDFDRLTGSPEMLALFHGALTEYGAL